MKILLIGSNFGAVYAKCLHKFGIKVDSVVSTNPEKVKEKFFKELDYIPNIFSNYREALSKEKFTHVIISTPPSCRYEIVAAAAKAKCQIIVDKPFSESSIECYKMQKVCKDNGVSIICNYTCLFNKLMNECLWSHSGNDRLVAMNFGGPKKCNFDVVYEWTPHPISLATDVFGLPSRVEARGNESVIEAYFDYANGVKVRIRNCDEWTNKVRNILSTVFLNGVSETISYSEIDGIIPDSIRKNGKEMVMIKDNDPMTNFLESYLDDKLDFEYNNKLTSEITYLNELCAKSLVLGRSLEVNGKDIMYA